MFQELIKNLKEAFELYTLEDVVNDVWNDIGADAEEATSYSKGDRERMAAEILLGRVRDSSYFREDLDDSERQRWEAMSYEQKMQMCLETM